MKKVKYMKSEAREKKILMISLFSGLAFAMVEFIFSIYSHSQSALTDAVYDASELVFIALLIYLTPLFHKPISEEHPYGYFQLESIFVIIKGVMMLSVTFGIAAQVIGSAISGGNPVNSLAVGFFQLVLGAGSVVIFLIMKRMNRNICSPTVHAELVGWKLDIGYSFGMAVAFFGSLFLENTPFAFIAPYFDQIIAVLVMVGMLPESIKILWAALKDIVLFAPDEALVEEIKEFVSPILAQYNFEPAYCDVTRTGRHLWIDVYFRISGADLPIQDYKDALGSVKKLTKEKYQECTCELILLP